jgi:hypothetical protein
MLLGLTDASLEYRPMRYLIRQTALVLALIAIIAKHRVNNPRGTARSRVPKGLSALKPAGSLV